MEWKEYKSKVAMSREVIVFPFFRRHTSEHKGVGLDIGCGDGDLTCHVAVSTEVTMIGIDNQAESLTLARARNIKNLYFAYGDIEKNAIPNIGICFDFAISNCCFSHISDHGIHSVLTDLHFSLKLGAEFIFFVPSMDWAREKYSNITQVPNGITAVPRYGNRQSFRIPEWYISALRRCGFDEIKYEAIRIPDDERLELRYREKTGSILFDAYIAKRAFVIPEIESHKKAFDIAHENRKLEISLFWQRSLFFWGFVASALVGYGAAYGKSTILSSFLALFGFVCSVVWTSGNRGSKYWQQYWEKKVNFYQHYTTGNIFYDRIPHHPRIWENYAPRRISVSKLTMALSDYMVILWFILCVITVFKPLFTIPAWVYEYGPIFLLFCTLLYCSVFLWNSRSED